MVVTSRFAVAALLLILRCLGVVAGTHLTVGGEECPNDCAGFFKRLDGNGIQETKLQLRGGWMCFPSALNSLMCVGRKHISKGWPQQGARGPTDASA